MQQRFSVLPLPGPTARPPFRFKQNGWLGNGVVGFSYETLPWLTAATAMTGLVPETPIWIVALLYGLGAHGILTLNDFKAIAGDKEMGIRTLPVLHGERSAAIIACVVMNVAQAGVVVTLWMLGLPVYALAILFVLLLQMVCMVRFARNPVRFRQSGTRPLRRALRHRNDDHSIWAAHSGASIL
ncbi:UbiA family prenyltransferase [Roseibium alexandrii]|uniref:UbiA family prenyltransferase n=1 Tax=Roseibium alexandrii TaxID=388408 RepID=UPI00375287A9